MICKRLRFNQGTIEALIFKIETMEYVAERSQLHLFSFQTRIQVFFSVQNVCYCSNIDGLFKALKFMELILRLINSFAYNWNFCDDLQVIDLL